MADQGDRDSNKHVHDLHNVSLSPSFVSCHSLRDVIPMGQKKLLQAFYKPVVFSDPTDSLSHVLSDVKVLFERGTCLFFFFHCYSPQSLEHAFQSIAGLRNICRVPTLCPLLWELLNAIQSKHRSLPQVPLF